MLQINTEQENVSGLPPLNSRQKRKHTRRFERCLFLFTTSKEGKLEHQKLTYFATRMWNLLLPHPIDDRNKLHPQSNR